MRNISLEELLEAGCHFGHQVSRQNSKARDFIFEARDKIHIIDLEKTKEGLEDAGKYVRDLARKGGTLLVVGTKRQAEAVLKDELNRLQTEKVGGLFFVTKRWIGGTLTNFAEVAKNYRKLKDISYMLQDDFERAKYTKKELGDWDKDRQKLESFYGGVADMSRVPDALFIIDSHMEHVAAQEAKKNGVPTVGITDTNADPTIISYPIPANDDAVGSLKLIISYIFDAWIEGKKAGVKDQEELAVKEAKAAADVEKAEEKKELKKKEVKEKVVKETKVKEKSVAATAKRVTKKKEEVK